MNLALRRGARYADARVQFEESTGFIVSEGLVEEGGFASVQGIGLRVIVDGAWGFCSMDGVMSESKLGQVVDRAVRIASQSSKGALSPVDMALANPVRTRVVQEGDSSDNVRDFPFETVLEPFKECDRRARSVGSEIRALSLSFAVDRAIDTFASSENTCITQVYNAYLGTLFVIASDSGNTEYYPYDFGGLGDYHEYLDTCLPPLVEEIAMKARLLSKSRSLTQSADFKTILMDPGFTALWVHEAIGHPLEADRVLGGKGDPQNAPWTYKELGKKVAGVLLNVVDDPSLGTPAHYKYDSEGIEGKRKVLVGKGVLKGCIHSRETARAFQA